MINLEQQSAINSQEVYFNRATTAIDKKIADGDLTGLHRLSPFTEREANEAAITASKCNKKEIFDYLFENYALSLSTRGHSIINWSSFGDLDRVDRLLKHGENISTELKSRAIANAVIEGHRTIVSRLVDLGFSKNYLNHYAKLAEEHSHEELARYLSNAAEAVSS